MLLSYQPLTISSSCWQPLFVQRVHRMTFLLRLPFPCHYHWETAVATFDNMTNLPGCHPYQKLKVSINPIWSLICVSLKEDIRSAARRRGIIQISCQHITPSDICEFFHSSIRRFPKHRARPN